MCTLSLLLSQLTYILLTRIVVTAAISREKTMSTNTVAPIAASNSIYIVKSEVAETKMCRDGQQTLTSCTLFQILHLQHTVLFQTKSPMSTFRFVSATTNWTSTNQQILESMCVFKQLFWVKESMLQKIIDNVNMVSWNVVSNMF